MTMSLAEFSTSAVLTAAVVAAWRWRGGSAARDERDGAEVLAAWWRRRGYPLALFGVALIVLAVATSSVIDAVTLALAAIVWILAEMRRALDARRHASQRVEMAGVGVAVAMVGVFLVTKELRTDGVVWALDALLIAFAGLLFLARRFVDRPMPGRLALLAPLFSLAVFAWTAHSPFAPHRLRTVEDAVAAPFVDTAAIVEHLDAAGVPYDQAAMRALIRNDLDETTTLASFLAHADDVVRLGRETDDDVARWRMLRAAAEDEDLDHPTSLRLLARHGAPDVDRAEIAARAVALYDAAPPDERLAAAITAFDVLDALGDRAALAALVDDAHARIMERGVRLPAIDALDFGAEPDTFELPPVCDVTAFIRRAGPPPGLDIAGVARGARHAASSGTVMAHAAAAAHAELVARDDHRLSAWRRLVRHRVALGAALVILVALAGALPTLRAPRAVQPSAPRASSSIAR